MRGARDFLRRAFSTAPAGSLRSQFLAPSSSRTHGKEMAVLLRVLVVLASPAVAVARVVGVVLASPAVAVARVVGAVLVSPAVAVAGVVGAVLVPLAVAVAGVVGAVLVPQPVAAVQALVITLVDTVPRPRPWPCACGTMTRISSLAIPCPSVQATRAGQTKASQTRATWTPVARTEARESTSMKAVMVTNMATGELTMAPVARTEARDRASMKAMMVASKSTGWRLQCRLHQLATAWRLRTHHSLVLSCQSCKRRRRPHPWPCPRGPHLTSRQRLPFAPTLPS